MGNLFHKSKRSTQETSRIQENDRAVAELKITRDKLRAYQKKLESNINNLKQAINECIHQKKRDQAMLALRKQKFLEKNLSGTHGQLLNIDSLIMNVENSQIQQQVVKALQQGNNILKQINKELTVEDVDKLMAETEEAIEYQHQIGLALSNQGIQEDDDLLEQLDKLEVVDYDIPSVPNRPLIAEPDVSNKKRKIVLENN